MSGLKRHIKSLEALAGWFYSRLLVLTVCVRLVWLHVLETQYLRDISDEITIRYQKIPAYRGMITDRFAQPLAVSTPVAAIAVRPERLSDSSWHEKLASLINSDAEVLRNRVAQSSSPFCICHGMLRQSGQHRLKRLGFGALK